MAGLEQFNIKFVHLKPGRFDYDFKIENSFFDHFEHSLVDKADIRVHCTMIKESETLLYFHFQIDGALILTCDRCLDEFNLPIHLNEKLMVKITDVQEITSEEKENEEELVAIPINAIAFNVAKPIFDYLNLAKPMKPSCEGINKTCNEDMMDILSNMQRKKSRDDEDDIDPRWEDLKQFFNKNKN